MRTPDVSDLTARFRSIDERDQRDSTERARQKGAVLEEGKKRLRGTFTAWVKGDLCVRRSTSHRCRDVYRLSLEHPEAFERHRRLGPTKLARIARVRPDVRERLLDELDADVCTPERLFEDATRPYLMRQPKKADPLATLRRRVSGLVGALQAAAKTPPALPRELRTVVRIELVRICQASILLRSRWGLDAKPPKPAARPAPPKPAISPTPPSLPARKPQPATFAKSSNRAIRSPAPRSRPT